MLAVFIIGVVALFTGPLLSDVLPRNDLVTYSSVAADSLHEARSGAMSGKGTRRFGVHFESDRFVLFEGAAYNPADPDNTVHDLPGDVSITDISLSDAGSDVLFASHRGVPSQYGTVEFSDSGGETRTVTVGEAGMLDVN
ncbi:hypothetical protein AMJ57_01310 [Parcubacteria bacterium SG8_24]|nr:MAG: hypothetical protein AMJ57_01310 [Parcubacteria bacterium SG8_24]